MAKVFAVAAAYNEVAHIHPFLKHYLKEGCHILLLDHGSDDGTSQIVKSVQGYCPGKITYVYSDRKKGSMAGEDFSLVKQLEWKHDAINMTRHEYLDEIPWFISVDIDEHLVVPRVGISIAGAVNMMEQTGCTDVQVVQAVFVPTEENPDHNHSWFDESMTRFYPMQAEGRGNCLFKWHKNWEFMDAGKTIELRAPYKTADQKWILKHYFFLSMDHAKKKWGRSVSDQDPSGWHKWDDRPPTDRPNMIKLIPEFMTREWFGPHSDMLNPYARHLCRI